MLLGQGAWPFAEKYIMSDPLTLDGLLFSMCFYLVCPDGHVHTADIKFQGLAVEHLNQEELTRLRDNILEMHGDGWRMATLPEIDRFLMEEQFAEDADQGKVAADRQYFMAPGVQEAQ